MRKNSQRENAGEQAETIVAGHEGLLLRYACLILGDSNLAQDVVEKAFIQVLKGRNKCPGLSIYRELTAELYRAVHNAAIALIPAKKRGSGEAGDAFPPAGDAVQGRAMEAVRRLGPDELQIVILKIFERMPNAEVSRITRISEEKVATLLYKSVIKVADELKKAGLL